jgi:acetyltransferase-like isoleucine patch superfamily enzyme
MLGLKTALSKELFKLSWRRRNKDNYTVPGNVFNTRQVTVGRRTYGTLNINLGTNPLRHVDIGSYCSIAPDVSFIINPHNYRFFSSWPWQRYVYDEYDYAWETKLSITVEDDVWIGQGVTILGGARLCQGCVIGAGSVVTSIVPPYAIFAGGRVIRYRFTEAVCEKLVTIDYGRLSGDWDEVLRGWHKREITEDNVDALLGVLPVKE